MMNVVATKFADVFLLEPKVHGDHRGYFLESYRKDLMEEIAPGFVPVQDNQSMSRERGVLRGLHYQLAPMAQGKLVRVLAGAIYDVVVDIRLGSPTYGQWEGYELSGENYRQLLVPRGYAHGFCTLVPETVVFYKADNYYSPEHDRGIRWNDPGIGVVWPVEEPILSGKDETHPMLAEAENNFQWEGQL